MAVSKDPVVNQVAFTAHDIRPDSKGQVRLFGTYWQATSKDFVKAGVNVLVTERHGLTLCVRPVSKDANGGASTSLRVSSFNQL
jgi:membrane-bound ClpP family serine protease